MNKSINSAKTWIITLVLLFLISDFSLLHARNVEHEKLTIDLETTQITVHKDRKTGDGRIFLSGNKFFYGSAPNPEWEMAQVNPTVFHIRLRSWKNFFWHIDCAQKKVWRMKGVDLKSSSTEGELLSTIRVTTSNDFATTPGHINSSPSNTISSSTAGTTKNVPREVTEWLQSLVFSLRIDGTRIVIDMDNVTMELLYKDTILAGDREWEIRRLSPEIFHFRSKRKASPFWQLELSTMTLSQVDGGNFGFQGGRLWRLTENITPGDPEKAFTSGEMLPDIEMTRFRGRPPKSLWQESEKALNKTVLNKGTYDVLIIPFQVSGYAIDRVDRALMTRYLSRALETSTDNKFPSPTLMMRALGESTRTLSDYEIFQLANNLGVKQIIRGYVGHNLNQQMNITIFVHTRNEQEYFSPNTNTTKYEWKNVIISDERTPGESFASILHDVTARILPDTTKKKAPKATLHNETALLPSTVFGLIANKSTSPIVRASYLQLLGMLHPEDSVTKEQLFARSLVVLREVSPQSAAFKLLKARALFHLYRRPAAIATLGDPKSTEERALSAVLDGNLPLLQQSIKNIQNPLQKMMFQIELSDLLWAYSSDQARIMPTKDIATQYPAWEMVLTRRLQHQDNWAQQSNIEIKKELDQLFPIDGFTLQDIFKNKVAVGDMSNDDDDVIFSAYNHYRRLMENQADTWVANESNTVIKRDILDIMVSIGESNLLKKLRLRRWQALNEEIVTLADRYETLYQGHPEIEHQKAIALYRIAYTKQGQVQQNLNQQASQLQRDVCYWSQGQTWIASQRSCFSSQLYNADFPRRSYWSFSIDPKALSDRKYQGTQELTTKGDITITPIDRKEMMHLELSLLYTATDFSRLSAYYDKLLKSKMDDEAIALLKKNNNRFIGDTSRTSFFGELAEKEGAIIKAKALYEENIGSQPNVWSSYANLVSLLIHQGNYHSAFQTAMKYPLFATSKDEQEYSSVSTVSLSNYAYDIGHDLWLIGAPEEAKPLFSLSSGYDTGSGAGILSGAYLAIFNRDFKRAAYEILTCAKRYNQPYNYDRYAELLHGMGFHEEAWSVLQQTQNRTKNTFSWSPVLIGHRMEGKTTEEQLQWLKKQPEDIQMSSDAATLIFLMHALDRMPNLNLAKLLFDRQEQLRKAQGLKQGIPAATQQNDVVKEFLQKHADPVSPFADGYVLLKRRKFIDAYSKLKIRFSDEWIRKNIISSFAMPYLAWSAAKSENLGNIEARLAEYRKELNDDFDYYLSKAFLHGAKKEHPLAIQSLKAARNHMLIVHGKRIFPTWYQLIEACEWLYEDSKYEGYLELLREYARIHQAIRPMDSWAYAFEAKYTTSPSDRTKALAFTLYLDKQSTRIEHFSGKEKAKAREWFKNNNPFLQTIAEKKI